MVATEARKNASGIIWNSLPDIITHNIEDAVNKGKFECAIIFNHVDSFNKCTEYSDLLKELGYILMMNKVYDKYVIIIRW